MQKHLCFVIGNYNNGGGTERVLSEVANGLVEHDYKVTILSLGRGLSPRFSTDEQIYLRELNIARNARKKKEKQNFFASEIQYLIWKQRLRKNIYKKIYSTLQEIGPDVVIAVDIILYEYIEYSRRKLGFKAIAWEHFCLEGRNGVFLNWSRYLATRYADRVVVLSNSDLEAYQKKYPNARKLQCIYNPITYTPRYNADMENHVIVAAGRLVNEKGFDLLIDVWSQLGDQIGDWELRIYGEGVERKKLQTMIEERSLKNISLCGFSHNLRDDLAKASIFACSSRLEGWGLVLIEALSNGIPCVSFNCKVGPKEIIDDGVNGILVPSENTGIFAKKLLLLMRDDELRHRYSSNAHKDLYKFSKSEIVGQWKALIETI